MNSDNQAKRQSLTHAKLHLLSIMIDSSPSLLKNTNDIKNILHDVCLPIIIEEYSKFKKILDARKNQNPNDSQDENEI